MDSKQLSLYGFTGHLIHAHSLWSVLLDYQRLAGSSSCLGQVSCEGKVGRYVQVQLKGQRVLNFREFRLLDKACRGIFEIRGLLQFTQVLNSVKSFLEIEKNRRLSAEDMLTDVDLPQPSQKSAMDYFAARPEATASCITRVLWCQL